MKRSNLYALKRDFETKKQEYFAKFYIHVFDDNLLEIYQLDLTFMQNNVSIYIAKAMTL